MDAKKLHASWKKSAIQARSHEVNCVSIPHEHGDDHVESCGIGLALSGSS